LPLSSAITSHRSFTTPPTQLTYHAARNARASYDRAESRAGSAALHPCSRSGSAATDTCYRYIPSRCTARYARTRPCPPAQRTAPPSPGASPPPVLRARAPNTAKHGSDSALNTTATLRVARLATTATPNRGATAPRALYHPPHPQLPLLLLRHLYRYLRRHRPTTLHHLAPYHPLRACSSVPTATAHSSSGSETATSHLPHTHGSNSTPSSIATLCVATITTHTRVASRALQVRKASRSVWNNSRKSGEGCPAPHPSVHAWR
jgi:hypothetical protein